MDDSYSKYSKAIAEKISNAYTLIVTRLQENSNFMNANNIPLDEMIYTIHDYISNLANIKANKKILVLDSTYNYSVSHEYEDLIQKLEADLRGHIKTEFEMRLEMDNLEKRLIESDILKQELAKLSEKLRSDKKENEIASLKMQIKAIEEKFKLKEYEYLSHINDMNKNLSNVMSELARVNYASRSKNDSPRISLLQANDRVIFPNSRSMNRNNHQRAFSMLEGEKSKTKQHASSISCDEKDKDRLLKTTQNVLEFYNNPWNKKNVISFTKSFNQHTRKLMSTKRNFQYFLSNANSKNKNNNKHFLNLKLTCSQSILSNLPSKQKIIFNRKKDEPQLSQCKIND